MLILGSALRSPVVALGEILITAQLFFSLSEAVPYQRQMFPVRHRVFAEANVSHHHFD